MERLAAHAASRFCFGRGCSGLIMPIVLGLRYVNHAELLGACLESGNWLS